MQKWAFLWKDEIALYWEWSDLTSKNERFDNYELQNSISDNYNMSTYELLTLVFNSKMYSKLSLWHGFVRQMIGFMNLEFTNIIYTDY